MLRCSSALFVCCLLLGSAAHAGLVWPSESEWIALTTDGGGAYSDPLVTSGNNDFVSGTGPDEADIVGGVAPNGNTYPGGFWYYQANGTPYDGSDDQIMFRIRVEDRVNNPQDVFQVFLETDGDTTKVEWVLQLDLKTDNQVELAAVSWLSTDPIDWSHLNISGTNSWGSNTTEGAPVTDYMQGTAFNPFLSTTTTDSSLGLPASNFGDDIDYFVSFGMPWPAFTNVTGLTNNEPFRVALATSQNHNNLNKDAPGSATSSSLIPPHLTDPITAPALPEPSTYALFGLGALAALIWRRRQRAA